MARIVKIAVCKKCGSENVYKDAWAVWNHETESFSDLGNTFDYIHCDNCEGEADIEIVEKEVNE